MDQPSATPGEPSADGGRAAPVGDAVVDTVDVALPDDLTAPGAARSVVREALERWRLPVLRDAVVLAVSELVTNAVRHGRPPVQLTVLLRRGAVQVDVRDHDPAPPGTSPLPDDDAESGRGVAIVAGLADASGVEQLPDDGKVVHARFDTGSAAGR